MKLPVEMKTFRRLAAIALCASAVGLADDSQALRYDRPIEKNLKRLDHAAGRSPINNSFMTQALPLGNGRLGAMFSGHVDLEYLVFNDITLWMNATRGESEFKQSGSPADGKDHLETVRSAVREGKFGSGKGSVESLGTQYLASKLKLGNFSTLADLEIQTGHDPGAATDYRRSLDLSTAVGAVSYKVGDATYTREYFCSHPQDLFVARFTADGGKMDLSLKAITAHKKHTIESKGRDCQGDALRMLQAAEKLGYAALKQNHVADVRGMMQRVDLDPLPALPSAWPKGSIKGLRARGGFEVDIEWKDGQLTEATIRANRDGSFRIYAQDKLSEVISLKKGQSKVWPGTQ